MKVFIIVALVLMLNMGAVYWVSLHQEPVVPEPIRITVTEYVDRVEYIDRIEYIDRVEYVEVIKEVRIKPRYFESLEELEDWLVQDRTDTVVIYPPDYDCEDYAKALVESALKDGYILSTELWGDVKRRGEFGGTHFYNLAFIGNEMYLIEPQDDRIIAVGNLD